VVGRTTSCGRIDALKTKCAQVEFIDENIDHAHWIFFGYVIVQTLRQQGDLRPSLTFDESLHDRPATISTIRRLDNHWRFHTAWVESGQWSAAAIDP